MLHILFIALKVIGFIILAILCIILLLLTIILISPFRYQVSGSAGWEEKKFEAAARLTWLLKLIKVDFKFQDMKPAFRVKIAKFTLLNDGYEEEPVEKKKNEAKNGSKAKKAKRKVENEKTKEDKPDEREDEENYTESGQIYGKNSGEQSVSVEKSDSRDQSSETERSESETARDESREDATCEIHKETGQLCGEDSGKQPVSVEKSDSGSESTASGMGCETSNNRQGSSEPDQCEGSSGELCRENSGQQSLPAEKSDSTEGSCSSEAFSGEREPSREGSNSGEDHSIREAEKTDEEISEEETQTAQEEIQKKSIKFKELKEKILKINQKIKTPFQKIEKFQENLENKLDEIEGKLDELEQKIDKLVETKDEITNFIDNSTHKKAFFKILRRALHLVKKYLPRKGEANIRFGLEDPYLTGVVFAFLAVLDPLCGGNIYATPEGNRFVLDGSLAFKGHVRLIHIITFVLSILFTPAVWRTVLDARKLKFIKK